MFWRQTSHTAKTWKFLPSENVSGRTKLMNTNSLFLSSGIRMSQWQRPLRSVVVNHAFSARWRLVLRVTNPLFVFVHFLFNFQKFDFQRNSFPIQLKAIFQHCLNNM